MAKLILFNKPFQVLSQFGHLDDKKSLKDFLYDKALANCYPAGRLDYDSEGLLLLTDDGQLQHQIAHPSKKLTKRYWVQVEGIPEEKNLEILRQGVALNDGPCKPAKVRVIDEPNIAPRQPPIRSRQNDQTTWLEIIISEGRNRQVRRMVAAIGFPCLRLIRFQIGTWTLDNLLPGNFQIIAVNLPKQAASPNKLADNSNTIRNSTFQKKKSNKKLYSKKANTR